MTKVLLLSLGVLCAAGSAFAATPSRHFLNYPPVVRSAPGQKSGLDGFQFDGVLADAALKASGWTRRHWIELYPVDAKEYWRAWDCKDRKCDAPYYRNIRAKAALIPRTEKDPAPAPDTAPGQ
jgi:hypothetical protein